MASILSCNSVRKSFTSRPLIEELTLNVDERERIGVLGPNGAGKSTLLRMIAGLDEPDSGTISKRKDLRIAYLPQEDRFTESKSMNEVLADAAAEDHLTDEEIRRLVGEAKSIVGLTDLDRPVSSLSGGWKKRLAIAAALVRQPDLLLLDEPTNHLDLEGIIWLERFLKNFGETFILISHDRTLLENVTNRVVEINRVYPQGFFGINGNYSRFLEKREQFLEGVSRYEDGLRNKVRREIEWLRQGVKARGTKAKGRIQEAERMIGELKDYQERSSAQRTASLEFLESGRKTKKLVVAEEISKSLGGRKLFENVTFVLSPGVRIGVVGPNGSGKSTLLKLLAGTLEPDSGKITHARELKIVSFEQNRGALDRDKSVKRTLASEGDSVVYRGQSLHVAAWLKRFLFKPEQLEMPVRSLSGGEQARLLIAKLMLQPADLLLLDEPTNDLDIETLQVLEESLEEFAGAVILVTHDRFMLGRVTTSILGIHDGGRTNFFATYEQYQSYKPESEQRQANATSTGEKSTERKKLSYKEQRELDGIEEKIAGLEKALLESKRKLESVENDAQQLRALSVSLAESEAQLAILVDRWAELEAKRGGGA